AALSALLEGSSIYDASGSPRNLASLVRDRVPVPPSIVGCRQVEDMVGEAGRTYLEENHKRMRGPIHEIDFDNLPTPYFDPLLKRNEKKYRSCFKDLTSRGLPLATLTPPEQAGLFIREKSDGHKMRMIVGARRANAWFYAPPSAQLLSCEGFGRAEVRPPEGVAMNSARAEELLGKFRFFLGMTDVKECFYSMRIPLSLAKLSSLPAAPAHALGLAGQELEGARLGPDTLVFPCIGAPPTGSSRSLFLAQDANEERVVSSNPWPGGDMTISERLLVSDRGPPLVMDFEPGIVGGAYAHVDNLGAITPSETIAQEAPGAKLDLELMRSGVSDGRFWTVYMGLGGLLARGRATERALEMVLGHCTFCGLALRGSLRCRHASDRFIQRHRLEPARLWPEVAKEVKMFRGLLVLMVQDWRRPWNSCVLQTDASESGWGMAQSFWPLRVVGEVGRLPERARFRSAQGRPARESALAAVSLVQDSSGVIRSVESVINEESSEPDALSAWDVDPDFAEVPWEWAARKERHFSALDDRDANGQDLAGDGGEAAEGDSSSSGSDSVIEHLGRGRARMRQLRARSAQRRAKLHADAILAAQEAGVSLLETLAATRPTQVKHQRYLDLFHSRVGLKREDIVAKADAEIDELFCNYLTENYLQGEQSSH
ncbi:unnamed protein product, partial [Prorocentrum cordatum]